MKPTKKDIGVSETKNKINDKFNEEARNKIKEISAKLKKYKIKQLYESSRETYTGV